MKLSEFFLIKTSKSIDKGKLKLKNTITDYQFIGRTSNNNGVQGYVEKLDFEPNPANTFSVVQIGENVMQFREKKWYASQNLFLLTPKSNEIIETKLFFIAVVNSSLKQFTGGYAHYPTLESLKGLDIYIPQYNNGQNAYQFMNDFIMALQVEPIVNLYEYLQLKGLTDTKLSEKERTAIEQLEQGKVSFEWFDVVDIFNVKNTFNILSRDIISDSGNTPYLSASKENNAVSTYISYDQRFLDKGNCIFIGGKTFVVTYQAQDFFSNDSHNLCLHLKNKEIATKLIQLFMKTCLEKGLGHKYSWGNSISSKKIQSDKLLLPIKDNIIDYPYMEILMSALQKGVLKEVMFWIKTQYGDLKINL